ncbi:hypothetical protein [Polyangium fumosum]|uniref:hypothetical protein n=1 Tax=Polyangium fumosum TaxID=889272 RepID=UPI001E4A2EC2|nr:hypothetical protein [Polyangium fumosum]
MDRDRSIPAVHAQVFYALLDGRGRISVRGCVQGASMDAMLANNRRILVVDDSDAIHRDFLEIL